MVDDFISAFNAGADSAIVASFGPQAAAYEYALGIDRFDRIDWLPYPWQRHGLEVPPGAESQVVVLDRLVSGSFLTQRERLRWRAGETEWRSLVRTVMYKVRGGRIHRIWYGPPEPDPEGVPNVSDPAFPTGEGPTIWFDAWHHNMHTPEGTYWPLAEFLRRHGYAVRTWEAPFTAAALDTIRLLVVPNGMPGEEDTGPGNIASAFSRAELRSLVQWVREGGALLLIADHDPYAGAAAALATEFGAEFHNGMARDTARARGSNIMYRRSDHTLRPHPVTNGRRPGEQLDSVATFGGQAFPGVSALEPLLVLPSTTVLEMPTPGPNVERRGTRIPAGGWLQAAVREFGEGRVALFGEAAVFRHLDPESGGASGAENSQLVLNLFRWLSSRE